MPMDPLMSRPDLLRELGIGVISDRLQEKILKRLFSTASTTFSQNPSRYDAYFAYFRSECASWSAETANRPGAIDTVDDFLDLVDLLRTHRNQALSSPVFLAFFAPLQNGTGIQNMPQPSNINYEIPLAKRYQFSTSDGVYYSIYFAIRLWLMINVGDKGVTITYKTYIPWPADKSLSALISATFPSRTSTDQIYNKVPRIMNLCNLERIGEFRISWTTNLVDHLRLDDDLDPPTVCFFQCGAILEDIGCCSDEHSIFPTAFIDETLHTFALFIPRANRDTRKWFQKTAKKSAITVDPILAEQRLGERGRSYKDYKYWHVHVTTVMQAFDGSEPRSLLGRFIDRRRKWEWYAFWIALFGFVLTVIFGLIQSIAAIMQVVPVYSSTNKTTR